MRISLYLQFTKYGLVFLWHVVTANKFGKGVLIVKSISEFPYNAVARSFENLGIGILASALALTSTLASALEKKLFCLTKSLFLPYMKKTSLVEYFSSTLADFLGSFKRYLEQLFCRKPINTCF